MTCDEHQELISELIDGELRDGETAGLFSHLGTCRQCRASLGMMMSLRRSLVKMPQPDVRPVLDTRVLEILQRHPRTRVQKRLLLERLWQNRIRLPFPALATLVFIALFSSAALLLSSLRMKEPTQQTSPRVVYLIGLEPVEVQGSYTKTARLPH